MVLASSETQMLTIDSWLDLGATWNFATQNGNTGDFDDVCCVLSASYYLNSTVVLVPRDFGHVTAFDNADLRFAIQMMADPGLSPFDMMAADYTVLDGDNPNLIF